MHKSVNHIALLAILIALSSCQTYEYLHSAQGSDYQLYHSSAETDTIIFCAEGGFLWGSGFNKGRTENTPREIISITDDLNYAWGQFSATRNSLYYDVAAGIKFYHGKFTEDREIFSYYPDSTEVDITNPYFGSSSVFGLTAGIDLALLPLTRDNVKSRLIGLSYRGSYDWGAYSSLRNETGSLINEQGDIALYSYTSSWLHTAGLFQDVIVNVREDTNLRVGYLYSTRPLNLLNQNRITGGFTFFTGVEYRNLELTSSFTASENNNFYLSARFIF